MKALLASARLPSAEVFIRLLRLISAFMSASVVWIFIITHLLLFKQNVMSEFMVVVGYIFFDLDQISVLRVSLRQW
ncbi:hypothetical protein HT118_06725 [Escherichia coli]|nr:hypothetical protein [Escherichia coli]